MAIQPNWSRNGGDFFRDLPVTKIIIAIWLVSFLTGVLGLGLNEFLAFIPGRLPNMITGLATHALVIGPDLWGLLINGVVFFWFGGSLERSWGTKTYLLFLLGATVNSALFWEFGLFLLTRSLDPLATPWLMLSSVVVAWAWLNPEQTILLWFVLPIKAKWIGWITIAGLFFMFPLSATGPSPLVLLLGIFALGGVAFAYYFIWYQRKWAWIPRKRRAQPSSRTLRHPSSTLWGSMNRPFREWQRRRRAAKLAKTFKFDD